MNKRDFLANHGDQDIPVYFSEYGIPEMLDENNFDRNANWMFDSISATIIMKPMPSILMDSHRKMF